MTVYESNIKQILKYGNHAIFFHIPIFVVMSFFFKTEIEIAILGPLLLGFFQVGFTKFSKNLKVSSALMGFSLIALSAIMIHLGKGMIEWHFHIFIAIGILSLLANPFTIVTAALTAAVHHIGFYFLLPESLFNYKAGYWIIAIHCLFVIVESVACTFLAYRFKKVLDLQEKINNEIGPLVKSIDLASKNTSDSCSHLLSLSDNNSSAMTQISSTSEEISQMVGTTKNQIESALGSMQETSKSVEMSSRAIAQGDNFIKSLSDIKESMEELQKSSTNQLNSVVLSVNTISEKTDIISDIVFQTKLLSFNASVEAARASEHGKGFAVVAEEIGNLASNSGGASEEISKIVNESKSKLTESVESISQNLVNFQSRLDETFAIWSGLNDQLRDSFKLVEENSGNQEAFLQQISSAADEQSTGVRELSQSLQEANQSSNQALSQIRTVEEVATGLEENSRMLSLLHEEIKGS